MRSPQVVRAVVRAVAADPTAAIIVQFEAKVNANMYVGITTLQSADYPLGSRIYEFVFGGWGNTFSVIRSGPQAPTAGDVATPSSPCNATVFLPFWVSLTFGGTAFMGGTAAGEQVLLTWSDPFPFIGNQDLIVGFSTWDWYATVRNVQVISTA